MKVKGYISQLQLEDSSVCQVSLTFKVLLEGEVYEKLIEFINKDIELDIRVISK